MDKILKVTLQFQMEAVQYSEENSTIMIRNK